MYTTGPINYAPPVIVGESKTKTTRQRRRQCRRRRCEQPLDAFCDRGSTFPAKCFLSNGVPEPKKRRNANLVSKNLMAFFKTWVMGVFIGKQHGFCCWSRFSGGVWSPLSEEPQKIQGEPLSQNASFFTLQGISQRSFQADCLKKRLVQFENALIFIDIRSNTKAKRYYQRRRWFYAPIFALQGISQLICQAAFVFQNFLEQLKSGHHMTILIARRK